LRKYLLAAFVLLLLGSTSLADEFFVTGQTNTEFCAVVMTQCPQINYFLVLTAEPTPYSRPTYDVVSLVGVVDGQYPIVGDGTGSLTNEFGGIGQNPAPDSVGFIMDNFHGVFVWIDLGPFPTAYMAWDDGQSSPPVELNAPVTWNITNITPEPSSIALLAAGVLPLLGLVAKRRRSSPLPRGCPSSS
jgi:hypothetical protein